MTTNIRKCEGCGEREAEFEIRKVSDKPASSLHRSLCKVCLGVALADDTASIVKISKSADEGTPPQVN